MADRRPTKPLTTRRARRGVKESGVQGGLGGAPAIGPTGVERDNEIKKFPTAFTILFGLIIAVAALSSPAPSAAGRSSALADVPAAVCGEKGTTIATDAGETVFH